ncbi:MAG: Smr/MutS family protein [Geminicoccaceae bacterium]|nr:Smr/MutS family protein [Geminicoccaceae bacterium]
MPIDARLDLHGLTQEQAHARLDAFIRAQQARGARCVLVITGLGRAQSGVLRHITPRWLESPAHHERVLAYGTAHPRDGGEGALYVMLRKPRT